jgi:hypothetical protein
MPLIQAVNKMFTPYGGGGALGSFTNPAPSVTALFAARTDVSSGYFYIKPSAAAPSVKHYCEKVSGVGWMLIMKHTSGIAVEPTSVLWNGSAYNGENEAIMNRQNNNSYASGFVGSYWSAIANTQVKIETSDNGTSVNTVIFNSASSTKDNFMSSSAIASSTFAGITTGTFNFFGVEADTGNSRHWFINRAYGGCNVDYGYLVVKGNVSNPCAWDQANPYYVLSPGAGSNTVTWDPGNNGGTGNRRGNFMVWAR